jgi:hypothetical protein
MAATIAWRICACRVWPDSAEIRNRPDHMAVSFRCGMGDVPRWPAFSTWLDQSNVPVAQAVAPINFSDRWDLRQ